MHSSSHTETIGLEEVDRVMMRRCINLAKESGKTGEYPYAAVICRDGVVVAESTNRVRHAADVTRHAEVTAISLAQRALGTVSLDDCDIYVNAEPCALCCYAIRETRIRRVVFGLSSPHMGGFSKWNILGDLDISTAMPEVFAPPPEIVSGYMAREAEQGLVDWNPLIARIILQRGLFGAAPRVITEFTRLEASGVKANILRFLRRNVFDHFGRRKIGKQ
jgi:tRNA(adenine34) deaminase